MTLVTAAPALNHPLLAHITTHPFYRSGVDEPFWGAVSNYIAVGCQLAAVLHLAFVVAAFRSERRAARVIAAVLVQVVVSALFLIACAFSVLTAAGLTRGLNVMPSLAELVSLVRPELTPGVSLAVAATFALAWGLSRLLLFCWKDVRPAGRISFVQALVLHPVAFPIGQLVGLMHAIYVLRTARAKHGG
jgi:hypothetical protein